VIDALGNRSTTLYDAAGNVTGSIDARADRVTMLYDAANRRTASIDALGKRTTSAFDAAGNLTESIDPLNFRTTYGYDALGRRTTVKDAGGGVATTGYDAVGNVTVHTSYSILDADGASVGAIDGVGDLSQTALDPAGRQKGSLDALGGYTANALDGSGQLRALTDPVGNEWKYLYDSLGRQTVSIDPLGKATTTSYYADGQVSTVTDRDGRQMLYSYDNGDRTTQVVWKDSGGTAVNTQTYSFDDNDNLLTAHDSAGTVAYSYDERDRVKSYTNVFGQVLNYSRDADGQVTKLTDSLGGTLTSVYDAQGRLTSRQFSGTGPTGTVVRVDFGYDNRDEQTTITFFSDLSATTTIAQSARAFDDAGRLTSIVNRNGSSVTLSYYNYTFDNADRVTNQTYSSAIGTVTYSGSLTYTYDATSQLTNDGSAYSYDANGNRTMAGYQTGSANRLTNDGTWTYTYDDAGNLVNKSKGAGLESMTFTYDNANRLVGVRDTSDGTTNVFLLTYTYDVENNRVQEDRWKTGEGSSTTRFVYDQSGGNVILDMDGSNTPLARRMFGDGVDQVLERTEASGTAAGVSVYFTDSLGSVRDVANASGVVEGHVDYNGYGVATKAGSAYLDRYGYTGRETQADDGLQYNRARYYDPSTGRWISQDTMGFDAGDSNLYRYVRGQPINARDPSGHLGIFLDGGTFTAKDVTVIGGFYNIYKQRTKLDAYYFEVKLGNSKDVVDQAFNIIVKAWKDSKGKEPIDIFGWSRGAMFAYALVNKLATEQKDISIRFLGLIDPALPLATAEPKAMIDLMAGGEIQSNVSQTRIILRDGKLDHSFYRDHFKPVVPYYKGGEKERIKKFKIDVSHLQTGYKRKSGSQMLQWFAPVAKISVDPDPFYKKGKGGWKDTPPSMVSKYREMAKAALKVAKTKEGKAELKRFLDSLLDDSDD
jgi:RHS repeat-associated protein